MNARQTKALKAKLIAEQQQAKTKIDLPKRVDIKNPYINEIMNKKLICKIPVPAAFAQCINHNFKQEPGMPGFKSF